MTAHSLIRNAAHDALCSVRTNHGEHVWVSPALFDNVAAAIEAALSAGGYVITAEHNHPPRCCCLYAREVDSYEPVRYCPGCPEHCPVRTPETDDGAVRSPATPGAVSNPAAQAGETGWRPAPSSPLPRPFLLFRIRDVSGTSGTGVVAWGCEFPDGAAALRWNGPHPSTAAWPSVDDIVAVHGHQGATVIHWLNGGA